MNRRQTISCPSLWLHPSVTCTRHRSPLSAVSEHHGVMLVLVCQQGWDHGLCLCVQPQSCPRSPGWVSVPHTLSCNNLEVLSPLLKSHGADVNKIPRTGCAGEASLPAGTQPQALPPPSPVGLHCPGAWGSPTDFPLRQNLRIPQP